MNVIIYKLVDSNECSLVIKKPFNIGDKMLFKIKSNSGSSVFFQTNVHHIAYKPVTDIYGNISIHFNKYSEGEFDKLASINRRLLQTISKSKYGRIVADKTYIDVFKDSILRLKGDLESIDVYDNQSKTVDIKYLKSNQLVRCIFQLESFWITKHFYGFNCRPIQLQIKDTIVIGYAFSHPINHVYEDEYTQTYRKMLKLGIPFDAVKQKMSIDGHPPQKVLFYTELLLGKKEKGVTVTQACAGSGHIPLPPPRPPPPPMVMGVSSIMSGLSAAKNAVIDAIKAGNFALKKVVVDEKDEEQKRKNKILKNVDRTRFAPSLQDILNAKHRLKSSK